MNDGSMPLDAAIRLRLEQTRGEVLASDLMAHIERDGLFIVGPTESLVECGVSIAMDDVDRIQSLIESGALRKPTRAERDHWKATPGARVVAIVVQPFVVIQLLAD
ncbi:MAG TPA: DUF2288 family protein [Polyangiaceae bacterium]|nr:DUF2288 family protein [Polyangiaceae bacterium]